MIAFFLNVQNGGYANGFGNDDRHDSTRILSYRSAVSGDNHNRPTHRAKRKRVGNEIDLNDMNADLVYVS